MKGYQFEYVGKKSAITQAVTGNSVRATKGAATVSPFNERGMVASPSFSLVRPNCPADQFEFSVKANALGDECWIAILLVRELFHPLATALGTNRVSAGIGHMERGAA